MSSLLSQIVINTRPVERAAPLTEHLQAAGMMVVEIPMLELQLLERRATDMALMRQWLAGDYQALVIVSPTAAASGLEVWQRLKQQVAINSQDNDLSASAAYRAPSHIIAVGTATAAVLQQAPVHIDYQVLQPMIANNEGMLAMPEIEGLQAGDKLLVWRGRGGRRLLVDTLQARGVHIDSIAWYERVLPDKAMLQYQAWLSTFMTQKTASETLADKPILKSLPQSLPKPSPKPIVIISSGSAFEHWVTVVSQTQVLAADLGIATPLQLADFSYVVLGERLANMVDAQQLEHYRVEDLAPQTLLMAIQNGQ